MRSLKIDLKNRTVIGIICIVAALIISFGVAPLTNRILDNKTEKVRVKKDIKAGQMITEDDIELVTVGAFNVPGGALSNEGMVLGRYAAADMVAGDYVFNEKLTYNGMTAEEIMRRGDGKLALSVTLRSYAAGISGKIENGDIVKAFVFKEGEVLMPAELEYLKVVTTTAQNGYDNDKVNEPQQPVTITVLVNEAQAERLIYYENTGSLHFALVHKGEDQVADELLEEQEIVLKQIMEYELKKMEEEVNE